MKNKKYTKPKPPTKLELAELLRDMADIMSARASEMLYLAGFNKLWIQHAGELAGASNTAYEWADCMEAEINEVEE